MIYILFLYCYLYILIRIYKYFFFFRKETDWIWSHMRTELNTYSNLIDNKKGVNNFIPIIDKLILGTNSMYRNESSC